MDSTGQTPKTSSVNQEAVVSATNTNLQAHLKESKTLVKQNGGVVEIVTLTLSDAFPDADINLNQSHQNQNESVCGSDTLSLSNRKVAQLPSNSLGSQVKSKESTISASDASKSLISSSGKRIVSTNFSPNQSVKQGHAERSKFVFTASPKSGTVPSTSKTNATLIVNRENNDPASSGDNQYLIVSNTGSTSEYGTTAGDSNGKLTFITTKLTDIEGIENSASQVESSLTEQINIQSSPHGPIVQMVPNDSEFVIQATHTHTHSDDNSALLKDYSSCLICGDKGSGFHYSVFSCEGCKGFFKRSVQKNLTYTCKNDGTCEITRFSRNNCQYCRFRKCLQFGMKKEGVRDDRTPGGLTRARFKRMRMSDHDVPITESEQSQIQLEGDVQQLVNCDPYIAPSFVTTEEKTATLYGAFQLTSILYDDMVYTVKWAKQVLGFKTLELDDQKRLLESCLIELSLLRLAYRSFGSPDGRLRFAHDIELTLAESQQLGFDPDYIDAVLVMVERLKTLDLDDKEYAILCTIVLFQEDAIGLRDTMTVLKLQKKYLTVLQRYVRLVYEGDIKRYGRILLRIPGLRTVAHTIQEVFEQFIIMDRPPIDDLIDGALLDTADDVQTIDHIVITSGPEEVQGASEIIQSHEADATNVIITPNDSTIEIESEPVIVDPTAANSKTVGDQ